MTHSKTLTKRLNKALGLFVSVPLFALPALAQDKTVSIRDRAGIRVGQRTTGIRVGTYSTGIRVPEDVKTGLRDLGDYPIKK